jgi:hypothetical protein
MPIWKSGPLLNVAVPIVAETVTQLQFRLWALYCYADTTPNSTTAEFPPNFIYRMLQTLSNTNSGWLVQTVDIDTVLAAIYHV